MTDNEAKPAQAPVSDEIAISTIKRSTWCRLYPIMEEKQAHNLKGHKYSGSDAGLSYKYCYSPLATKAVTYLPDWIAPNVLTLIGFVNTLIPMILLFTVAGFDLMGEVPQWWFFIQAVCYFIYRLMDEMDGKQARATQNSSPLGMLFDHGVDAFSTGFQMLLALRTFQVGNNFLSYAAIVMAMAAFHFTTLEEFYVGTLALPVCNAVSDGSILIIILYLVTGITGNEIWATEIVDGSWMNIKGITELTLGQIVVTVMCLTSVFIILGK